MFETFLSSIFDPLINLVGVLGFVIIISFAVSLLTVIVYKLTTNQSMMKQLREDTIRLNKEAKKNMHNQKKSMAIQKELMSKQFIMMKHSFTSTLITLLPLLILFGWMNANLNYSPIHENTDFIVSVYFNSTENAVLSIPTGLKINDMKNYSDRVDWTLSGKTGEYLLQWNISNNIYSKDVIISDKQKYSPAVELVNDGVVKEIAINYSQEKIFGWISWLWAYIIGALIFSSLLRKILRVY